MPGIQLPECWSAVGFHPGNLIDAAECAMQLSRMRSSSHARSSARPTSRRLETGWSPNNVRNVSAEQLAAIREDAVAFIVGLLHAGRHDHVAGRHDAPEAAFHRAMDMGR